MARPARQSLTLLDYSDRELLNLLLDEGDDQGWVDSRDLARTIGMHKDHAGSVGQRLGWMRRYGATERKDGTRQWRTTPAGRALALGDLDPEQQEVVEGLSSEQLLMLTRTLTKRYARVGDTAAHLIRREWRYGTHGRKFR
jgi:hypothetical protein